VVYRSRNDLVQFLAIINAPLLLFAVRQGEDGGQPKDQNHQTNDDEIGDGDQHDPELNELRHVFLPLKMLTRFLKCCVKCAMPASMCQSRTREKSHDPVTSIMMEESVQGSRGQPPINIG
jgi:hypothetical protein